jgi:hypothetical protein
MIERAKGFHVVAAGLCIVAAVSPPVRMAGDPRVSFRHGFRVVRSTVRPTRHSPVVGRHRAPIFSPKKYVSGLSVNTFLLAFASLFADISTGDALPRLADLPHANAGRAPASWASWRESLRQYKTSTPMSARPTGCARRPG